MSIYERKKFYVEGLKEELVESIEQYTDYVECVLWVEGATTILHSKFANMNDYNTHKEEAINLFKQGLIRCADCGKIMNYEENRSHRYFAGLYCDECWNGKWKAIEAQ